MRIPLCLFVSSRGDFQCCFYSSTHLKTYTQNTESLNLYLGSTLGSFPIPNVYYFFLSSFFTNELFLSKSVPQDTANRWGRKRPAAAGTPWQSIAPAQRTAGRTRKEGTLSFRAASREQAESRLSWLRLAPIEHHVVQEMQGISSLHRALSTRSSFLWSHSRVMRGKDWAHPIREFSFRKWRCITWWE